MGTQLVAVRAALIDALADLPAYTTPGPTGQKPELSFGWKTGWKRRERVWTQRARFSHEPSGMRAGKTYTNETGEFDLMIFVHGVGLSQETTSTRAAALWVAANDWISYKPNWNSPEMVPGIYEFQVVGNGELAEALDEKGSGLAEVRIPIRYRARLT